MVFIDYNKCDVIYYKYFDQKSKKMKNINLGNQICQGIISIYLKGTISNLKHQFIDGTLIFIRTVITFFIEIETNTRHHRNGSFQYAHY